MTQPKNVGLKRKNDGGPKNPTVMTKQTQLRNAIAGSKAARHEREPKPVTLPRLAFLEKKVDD